MTTNPANPSVTVDIDRGDWVAGESYYAGSVNVATGAIERSHVWHMGCKYRCEETLTEDEPGWPASGWAFEEGDPGLYLLFTGVDDGLLAAGETKEIGCRVVIYNQDVTEYVDGWEIRRDTGSETEDAAWGMQDKVRNFDGSIALTYSSSENDLGYGGKAVFRVTAYLSGNAKAEGELEI